MALTSGFFNAFKVDGDYDRKYNAEDYSDNMGAIIRTGVLRDANNGFRVTASGLTLSASPGRAWIEGHWAKLDEAEVVATVTPPTGTYSRIDSVVLRLDTTEAIRGMGLLYIQGVVAASPSAPDPVRADGIYDIVLAHIQVEPNATSVTVIDKRPDQSVCGWVTTPVGYDEWFANSESAFEEFFQRARDELASATMYKQYIWRTVLTADASSVQFDLPQYDPTGPDIINVYVNGLLEIEDIDYTLSGSTITFSTGGGGSGTKIAGTEIVVMCYKSIDGYGLGTVSDEITQLQNDMSELKKQSDYIYVCSGVNDHVSISDIVSEWLGKGSSDDYSHMTLHIYGTMGVQGPATGAGTSADPYGYFDWTATAGVSKRTVTLDFSSCSHIKIACPSNSYNVIFATTDATIIGANVIATGGASIKMFDGKGTTVNPPIVERCRLWITSGAGYIASSGTFRDCRCSVTTTAADAAVFFLQSGGLLRVFGGDHYAYCPTAYDSFVVWAGGDFNDGIIALTNAAVMTYGISCPTNARANYKQSYAVYSTNSTAVCSVTDTITTLPVTATNQNVRGTLAASIATM